MKPIKQLALTILAAVFSFNIAHADKVVVIPLLDSSTSTDKLW